MRSANLMVQNNPELRHITDARKIVDEVVARSGFMVHLGVETTEASEDGVILQVMQSPTLLQFDGLYHGGVIASLADHAGASAAAISLPRQSRVVTSNLNVTYLTAATGNRLWADAICIKAGKRIRAARVQVFTDVESEEILVAVADVLVSVG
jgi:uncharacterized protein (TIGR00369 family)